MTYLEAKTILMQHDQAHVLSFWNQLDDAAQQCLLTQIESLDWNTLERMRELLKHPHDAVCASDPTAPDVVAWTPETYAEARAIGEQALRAGHVAVLLVAGGQGSRLGYDGPKGAYQIGPLSNASLFYFHARKIVALCRRYKVRIPFYVMTSEANDLATREFFASNGFFGLNPEDVCFFVQGMWPALDQNGHIMLDAPAHVFMSPDGHGGTLSALAKNGCFEDMTRRGIQSIFYFQVDNPLVEIADPAFVGFHVSRGADISLKLCAKRDPKEGLGVVVVRDGRYEMVEYTELTDEQSNRRTTDHELYFKYGSVAIHLFSLEFMKVQAARELPLHLAHKKIPCCDAKGTVVKPETANGYKFEKFIFDVLPAARTVVNLAFDRSEEFSPVKNAFGSDSPESCRRDLQLKWMRWLNGIGVQVPCDASGLPSVPIEIDPAYALEMHDLLAKGLLLRAE